MENLNQTQVDKWFRYFTELSKRIHWVTLDEQISEKASQTYPNSIGALDAIHLSNCLLYQEEFEVWEYFRLTRDGKISKNASSIGLQVKG